MGLGALLMLVLAFLLASTRWKWLLILLAVLLLLAAGVTGFAFGRRSTKEAGASNTKEEEEDKTQRQVPVIPSVDGVLKSAIKNWASGGKGKGEKKSVSFGPTESQPFRSGDAPRSLSTQHTTNKDSTSESWA